MGWKSKKDGTHFNTDKTVRSSEPSTKVNIEIDNNSDDFSEGVRKEYEVKMKSKSKRKIKKHHDGTPTEYQLGDKVKISSDNDNENYNEFKDKTLIIEHVAVSQDEHPGYDGGLEGEALYDLRVVDGEDVPFSLYDYELESA